MLHKFSLELQTTKCWAHASNIFNQTLKFFGWRAWRLSTEKLLICRELGLVEHLQTISLTSMKIALCLLSFTNLCSQFWGMQEMPSKKWVNDFCVWPKSLRKNCIVFVYFSFQLDREARGGKKSRNDDF